MTPDFAEHVLPGLGRALLLPCAGGSVLQEGFFQPEPGLFLLDAAAHVRADSTGTVRMTFSVFPEVLTDAIEAALAQAVGRPALPVTPPRWVDGLHRLTLTAGHWRLVVEFGERGALHAQLVSADQRVSVRWTQECGQRAGAFYGKHGRQSSAFLAQAEADRRELEAHANGQGAPLSAALSLATAFRTRWEEVRNAALREQAARAAGLAAKFLEARPGT